MPFIFQRPGGVSLLDEVNKAAAGARNGGGVFAFATPAGAQSLLEAPHVNELLQRGGVLRLVVGMDAITNGATLLYLQGQMARWSGRLQAYAFLHGYPGIFHPKFSWFENEDGTVLLTGSGNLTNNGLRSPSRTGGNWEAFTIHQWHGEDARHLIDEIDAWFSEGREAGAIRDFDDPDVREAAMANSKVRPPTRLPRPQPPRHRPPRVTPEAARARRHQQDPAEIEPAETGFDAMIREIPRNRAGQADITQGGLEFLGWDDSPTNVLLQYVSPLNELGEVIERRLFVNASHNYRVELPEIAQLEYEVGTDDSRILLVAVRLQDKAYRYTIVAVGSASHRELLSILGPVRSVASNRNMRIKFLNSSELKEKWSLGPPELFPVVGVISED